MNGERVAVLYAAGQEPLARAVGAGLSCALCRASGRCALLLDGPSARGALFNVESPLPSLRALLAGPGGAPASVAAARGEAPGVSAMDGDLGDACSEHAVEDALFSLRDQFPFVVACVPFAGKPLPWATRVVAVEGEVSAALRALAGPGGARAFALPADVRVASPRAPTRPTRAEARALRARHGFPVLCAEGFLRAESRWGEPAPQTPLHDALARYAREIARQRVGVALGSGGPRGFFHIGVLEALTSMGVPIDGIAGSSAGAGIGGVWALGFDPDLIHRRYAETLRHAFWPTRGGGALFSGRMLHQHLSRTADGLGFDDMRTPFAAVAIDRATGASVRLSDGDFPRAVLASTAIPGLYPPVRIGDRWLMDGGLLEPVPTDAALELPTDLVIAVDLGARPDRSRPDRRSPALFATLRIAAELMHARLHHESGAGAALRLTPAAAGAIPLFERSAALGARYRERGRQHTLDARPALESLLPWLGRAGERIRISAERGGAPRQQRTRRL